MEASSPLDRAVALFDGSQAALARAAGVAQPTIWKAVKRGEASPALAIKIEKATNGQVGRHELRPDMWDAPSGVAA